jgi:hypothetical protein
MQQGEMGLGAAAARTTWWPDAEMLPARSSLANSQLIVVLPPRPPPIEPMLPPEKMSGPDPERRCPGCLGALFLLSATTWPEWMFTLPAPQPPPFTAEEEEDGVTRIRSGDSMAGDLADPRVGVGFVEGSKIELTGERSREVGQWTQNDTFILFKIK